MMLMWPTRRSSETAAFPLPCDITCCRLLNNLGVVGANKMTRRSPPHPPPSSGDGRPCGGRDCRARVGLPPRCNVPVRAVPSISTRFGGGALSHRSESEERLQIPRRLQSQSGSPLHRWASVTVLIIASSLHGEPYEAHPGALHQSGPIAAAPGLNQSARTSFHHMFSIHFQFTLKRKM
ncbi:hypothetical protein EYF80_048561 [Liparis tanakae]|uniref:Uncharacterized protein n=1 Tax=Liparis tanakae TaxID=230148 RepID=A0A4Z2FLX8_9TELE|nr:hypothetical protein EYF80_048561 [Liparis tanakae]